MKKGNQMMTIDPSIVLQEVRNGKRRVFAYLRRSTKKFEQKESLKKQNDSIDLMANDIGIPLDYIEIFEDDFTAFQITTKNGTPLSKRKGWNALMKEVDSCEIPCILLVYDISRLGRNSPDGIQICEKLGGYKNKQKIQYIRFYDGEIWDIHTRENEINTAFVKACGYSEALSKQKIEKNITSLRRSILPKTIKTPHGLKATAEGLEENEEMPIIYKAFELKADGTLNENIVKYLKDNGIHIAKGNLADMLFQQELYIGIYTHGRTGEVYDKLIFTKGKTPIPQSLWNRVQMRLGRKVGGYGAKQKGDVIGPLLKWEEDKTKSFSVETPKGKYKSYKSNAFGGFNKSEAKIIKAFLEEIKNTLGTIIDDVKINTKKQQRQGQKEMQELYQQDKVADMVISSNIVLESNSTIMRIQDIRNKDGKVQIDIEIPNDPSIYENVHCKIGKLATEKFEEQLKLSPKVNDGQKEGQQKEKEKLLKEKCHLEETASKETIELTRFLGKGIIKPDVYEATLAGYRKELQVLENRIESLSKNSDMEEFIERLPEVLSKTFELASKVLSNKDINAIRDDLYKLIEISTFELSVNTKKELKIKLFEVLNFGKKEMVGYIGFEPMTPCL